LDGYQQQTCIQSPTVLPIGCPGDWGSLRTIGHTRKVGFNGDRLDLVRGPPRPVIRWLWMSIGRGSGLAGRAHWPGGFILGIPLAERRFF